MLKKSLRVFALTTVATIALVVSPFTAKKANAATNTLDCRCALLGGNDSCSASNYGNGCNPAEATDCHTYDNNCSTATGT